MCAADRGRRDDGQGSRIPERGKLAPKRWTSSAGAEPPPGVIISANRAATRAVGTRRATAAAADRRRTGLRATGGANDPGEDVTGKRFGG